MQAEVVNDSFNVIINAVHSVENSLELSEEQLVAEAQGGSGAAFQRLVECYESRVFRVAKSIARCHEDAEEIMQDAFVQAYKNLSRFRGDSRFYTWLVRITINEGLMKMRRQRPVEISIDLQTEDGYLACEIEDWGPNPEQRYSQEQLHCILETAIAQLSPGYRVVFQLRDVEGFSTEETAQALALSTTAVKTRVRRARLQLRELLNPYFTPNGGRNAVLLAARVTPYRRGAAKTRGSGAAMRWTPQR
jgi:RNA polymerase sigma-70 factor, ECF subfamily